VPKSVKNPVPAGISVAVSTMTPHRASSGAVGVFQPATASGSSGQRPPFILSAGATPIA
jgi:hypothetical protein